MEITLRIPDDLAGRLSTVGEVERYALEALALEEYKLGHLTKPELRRLLGSATSEALDGFLRAHDATGLEKAARTPAEPASEEPVARKPVRPSPTSSREARASRSAVSRSKT
jgi:hypothetical protein